MFHDHTLNRGARKPDSFDASLPDLVAADALAARLRRRKPTAKMPVLRAGKSHNLYLSSEHPIGLRA